MRELKTHQKSTVNDTNKTSKDNSQDIINKYNEYAGYSEDTLIDMLNNQFQQAKANGQIDAEYFNRLRQSIPSGILNTAQQEKLDKLLQLLQSDIQE